MAELRRALAIAGLAVGAAVAGRASAAEPPPAPAASHARPSDGASRASAPKTSAAAADLELLEFLGSDDVEPEFQDYLANHAPAKAPAGGRSEKQ